ncbi:MAG: zinc ribbon domain-containing protein [Candidatus Aenigmarchaeota archaeon]|nr:zinc ribbon domain-containing protein [Candidatus Aenigmarchaeota archaeon]
MFWDKKCKNCGDKLDGKWLFCPSCGITLKETGKDVLQEVDREFRQIDKMMELKVPRFMLRPPLKTKGVSITITADNASPPKIDVQAYGGQKHMHHHHEHKNVRTPRITEEPETKIQKSQNRQTITLNLPDVKNLDDIEIKQLHQSIEIKAFAGDKAYFKLIPIPSDATVNNEFKDGVLKIEVVK